MEPSPPAAESEPPYAVSPKEAARLLSINVSTFNRHYGAAMRRGAIETHYIGTAVRVVWSSLIAYIQAESRQRRAARHSAKRGVGDGSP